MKKIITSFIVASFTIAGCKTKNSVNTQETTVPQKTIGKVSHQFRSTGCSTIIIVETKDTVNPLILIPRDPLPKKIDKNNLRISFNYHTLKTPQPQGCDKGIPAEITDPEKK